MNPDLISSDLHERAQVMIALSGPEGLSNVEQSWLAAHLESCARCREFAESIGETIRSLRAIPITAGGSLVSATRTRVRQRAVELQHQREWLWVVCTCCVVVTLCTALTTAVLWYGLAWLGQQARLVAPVWEAGFVVFYFMPAVLAGIFLLARGTCLAGPNGAFQG